MEWSEDFESGLADIDAQHRMIFALAQRIDGLREQDESDVLAAVIREALRFSRAHFGCEEQLMLAYDYSGIAQHRVEHACLLQEMGTLTASQHSTPREIALFICKWLMSHSLIEDRSLARHILKIRAEALGMTVEQLSAHITTGGTPSASYRIATVTEANDS